MNGFDRYFHGEYGAARVFVLLRVFMLMLALDTSMLMIGHAGRYGAGGFNVAHFAWLDALSPLPTPALYVGVLLGASLLALFIALTGVHRAPVAALFLLYSFSWSMSMLDSYQHHYFMSLLLVCMVFFPPVRAGKLRQPGARTRGFGYPLLCTTVAVLYAYAAVAKMDPAWLDGFTVRRISQAETTFATLVQMLVGWGLPAERFWALFSTSVIPLELLVALAYLLAPLRERSRSAWPGRLCSAGFVLAMGLHVGAEAMALQIGWFSYYMIALALTCLLPLGAVATLGTLLRVPAERASTWLQAWQEEEADSSPASTLLMTLGAGFLLCVVGWRIELPGALAAGAGAALVLCAITLTFVARGAHLDARRHVLAAAVAGGVLWLAIALSPVRWEYYRFLGGDLARRGEPEAALEAYVQGERFAPEGETRRDKIEALRRQLGK